MYYQLVCVTHPTLSNFRSRKKDKLRYRYPRGESYLDVIQRFAAEYAYDQKVRAPLRCAE